ncbi:hypothetical protein DRP04_01065 [Archaeoglobales archaeon]|nr:MAG: hypothetical protein DRP04_01065 [Archaeoglobales archaeon]
MQELIKKLFPNIKTDIIKPETIIEYVESLTEWGIVDAVIVDPFFDEYWGLEALEEFLTACDVYNAESIIEGLIKELYMEARDTYLSNPKKYERDYARFLEYVGEYFLDKEEPSKTKKYLFEAFGIRQRLLYTGQDAELNFATLLSKLAVAYVEMEEFKEAEYTIEEIHETVEKWRDYLDISYYTFACMRTGMHYLDEENYEKAAYFLERAVQLEPDENLYGLLGYAYRYIDSGRACDYLLKCIFLQYLRDQQTLEIYEILEELIDRYKSAEAHLFYFGLLFAEGMIDANAAKEKIQSVKSNRTELMLKALNGDLAANDLKNTGISLEGRAFKKLAMKVNERAVAERYTR